MLHLYKWRRRQINTYFLPKTGPTRRAVRQRAAAILAEKDVEQRVTKQSLYELRDTILETANVDPMEDIERTRQSLNAHAAPAPAAKAAGSHKPAVPPPPKASPMLGQSGGTEVTRFAQTDGSLQAGQSTLVNKDIRDQRDQTLRQTLRL